MELNCNAQPKAFDQLFFRKISTLKFNRNEVQKKKKPPGKEVEKRPLLARNHDFQSLNPPITQSLNS